MKGDKYASFAYFCENKSTGFSDYDNKRPVNLTFTKPLDYDFILRQTGRFGQKQGEHGSFLYSINNIPV